MKILEQISLADHSTMRLGGIAAYACEVADPDDLLEALAWAKDQQLPTRMIGSGSNIVWSDEGFNGLLIIDQIKHFEISPFDDVSADVVVGSGEDWDDFVARTVEAGYSGIEALSLIPGTCGATPIQNVGAYGQEVSQTLQSVTAYDLKISEFVTLTNQDCDFGYRSSRFNRTEPGRFLITSLTFRLTKTNPEPPFYPPVAEYIAQHNLSPSPATIREAVVAIRTSKLPDPSQIGNNGSFFSNPIISQEQFERLHSENPDIRFWPTDDGVKISGAWLIEHAGYKDYHDPDTGMATWTNQPLVLVNEKASSTADLLAFKQKIVDAVQQKFGVTLQQEPEYLP